MAKHQCDISATRATEKYKQRVSIAAGSQDPGLCASRSNGPHKVRPAMVFQHYFPDPQSFLFVCSAGVSFLTFASSPMKAHDGPEYDMCFKLSSGLINEKQARYVSLSAG